MFSESSHRTHTKRNVASTSSRKSNTRSEHLISSCPSFGRCLLSICRGCGTQSCRTKRFGSPCWLCIHVIRVMTQIKSFVEIPGVNRIPWTRLCNYYAFRIRQHAHSRHDHNRSFLIPPSFPIRWLANIQTALITVIFTGADQTTVSTAFENFQADRGRFDYRNRSRGISRGLQSVSWSFNQAIFILGSI